MGPLTGVKGALRDLTILYSLKDQSTLVPRPVDTYMTSMELLEEPLDGKAGVITKRKGRKVRRDNWLESAVEGSADFIPWDEVMSQVLK